MAKKKQPTYSEMVEQAQKIKAAMEQEKERMAGVMAAALLDDFNTAVKLGRYSDRDLQSIMKKLAGHIDECVAELETEKQARKEQSAPETASLNKGLCKWQK